MGSQGVCLVVRFNQSAELTLQRISRSWLHLPYLLHTSQLWLICHPQNSEFLYELTEVLN